MATVSERKTQVEHIWQESFQYELDTALKTRLRENALIGVQATLETALNEELTVELGFEPYERYATSPKPPELQRSGYFQRVLNTEYGSIPNLKVPKLRRGNKEREWKILTRYQCCLQSLLDASLYTYVLGLSLRDLQEMLCVFFGHLLSLSAINRVTQAVHSQVQAWQEQPIETSPPILIVDGVWVKILYPTGETWVDHSGHTRQEMRVQERVLLATLGVFPDGRWYLLHYEAATEESEATWQTFLEHLIARGLSPQTAQMVVSDGTKGLLPAMKTHLPGAELQRCTVHKVRGFQRYLRYQDLPTQDPETGQPLSSQEARRQRRYQITSDAHGIFQEPTCQEAEKRLEDFTSKWESLEPEAVHNFRWGIQRCFTFYRFAEKLHPLIRSSNLLERFFREFRSKADEIGVFPNEMSCLTIFHLVRIREHTKHNRSP
jgi:transposase-like protein